jgi:hypothetical protein
MVQTSCWICGDVVYEEDQVRCDACDQAVHSGCLSEEGEDGRLCAECIDECPGCEMPIVQDWKVSAHVQIHGTQYMCPLDPGTLFSSSESNVK